MARNYSVEDVETLRQKSGVSYEEAIRLLDKYDGDLASALIELEKSGIWARACSTRRSTFKKSAKRFRNGGTWGSKIAS